MLQVFIEEPGVKACSSLRRVICSGEALPWELQQRFFTCLDALHNLYGLLKRRLMSGLVSVTAI